VCEDVVSQHLLYAAIFLRDREDVHCQRILFGGSADNGYARLLGPLSRIEAAREQITLLEGPPFVRELAEIKDKFRTASFEKVFRCQKLVNPKYRAPSSLTPPHTPPANYATAAGMVPSISVSASTAVSAAQRGPAVFKHPATTGVLQNKAGQRVDSVLDYSQQDVASLKQRKLCNSFHILGKCRYNEHCTHDHDGNLSNKELVALCALARQSPCQTGLFCEKPECLSGHRCTRSNCLREGCWFSSEMHDVDTMPVARVQV
jgi:hypothetical protein